MLPHPPVAAHRPPSFGCGPWCRRVGSGPFGLLLGLSALLGGGTAEADEGAAASPAPLVRSTPVQELRDERLEAEAARAHRPVLELPPRLVVAEPSAALASARPEASASSADNRSEREAVAGTFPGRDVVQGGEQTPGRDAASEAGSASARPRAAEVEKAPAAIYAAAFRHPVGPPRWSGGPEEDPPADRASDFEDDSAEADGSVAAADGTGAVASRTSRTDVATQRDERGAADSRVETLSVVVGGFLPRPKAAHAGREGRAGEPPRPGLARPSGRRAGVGTAPSGSVVPPRVSSGHEDALRDWKLASGRWGLEHGGRLSMELDSGYRLSLKPRRGGLALSIRRNF